MTYTITRCTLDDLHDLQKISYDTFYETFKDQNSPENLHAYLDRAFKLDQLKHELSHPHSEFYFINYQDQLAGYLKVNIDGAQSEDMGPDAFEIERIYLKKAFQLQGLGKHLYNHALAMARKHGKKKIWLGVWEKNEQAIIFYEKLGFVKTGAHSFYMGREEQIDYIMEKVLT